MSEPAADVASLLMRYFSREEMAHLNQQSQFQSALAQTTTLADFEQLCQMGEELLAEREQANPASFRKSSPRTRPSN